MKLLSISFCALLPKSTKYWISLIVLMAWVLGPLSGQVTYSFAHNGINRTYILYVPQAEPSSEPMPLLFALHGFTQNGQTMMTLSNFNALAEEHHFVVAYPYGVNTSWNVGVAGGSGADDVGFLLALIDSVATKANIDQSRVYSTGFSNGGFMSYRLACEASDRFAAIAPVSGTMTTATYDACVPTRPVPLMHIHGTSDFVVPYNGNTSFTSVDVSVEYWNSWNNCPSEPEVFQYPDLVADNSTVDAYVYGPCNGGAEVRLLKVNNGGHTWPGNSSSGGIGITNMDISASAEIWNFVSRFSLSGTVGSPVERQKSEPKLFPNPLPQGTTLSIQAEDLEAHIQIVDLSGKTLIHKQIYFNAGTATINQLQLQKGIYFLHLFSGKNQRVKKLVVN